MQRILLVLLLLFIPAPTFAWWDCGHRIAAIIAYRQLSAKQRERLVEILRAHPKFKQDFPTPKNLDQADHDRYLFTQASVWPDSIRGQRNFDRPTWHYINTPFYLRPTDTAATEGENQSQPHSGTSRTVVALVARSQHLASAATLRFHSHQQNRQRRGQSDCLLLDGAPNCGPSPTLPRRESVLRKAVSRRRPRWKLYPLNAR